MLVELYCDKIIEPKITFNKTLNIVLGDSNATNSIGKSTFLMILDFIFGGKIYLEHNKDVLENIGNHEFKFVFEFDNKKEYFKRKVELDKKNNIIYMCNSNFDEILEVEISDYTKYLKRKYKLENINLTFRKIVSLYSRVWGKRNDSLMKPLHPVSNASTKDILDELISLFKKDLIISQLKEDLEKLDSIKKLISYKVKYSLNENLNKTEYKKKIKQLSSVEEKLDGLKENIFSSESKYTEEVGEKISLLLKERDEILKIKLGLNNEIIRLKNNIEKNSKLSSDEEKKIVEYFPNVNIGRIKEVGNFQNKITKILNTEINKRIVELTNEIENLEQDTQNLNLKLNKYLEGFGETSKTMVEQISNYILEEKELKNYTETFEKNLETKQELDKKNKEFIEEKVSKLNEIAFNINKKIDELNNQINPSQLVPELIILSENNYEFKIKNNTGTGKGFENLIIFDLAILTLTELPFLIHDSFIFKNIDIITTENILQTYIKYSKQIFIALDEKKRYGSEIQNLIERYKVLELSKEKVLFRKAWNLKNK